MNLESKTFSNILIIKPSSLGDVIRAFPIFHALREHFSQARISWLIRPDCAGILESLSGLDEIIEFDRKRYSHFGRNLAVTQDFFIFLKRLRQKRFDLVLDLQGLFRSGFICRATGAKVRLGPADAREGAGLFYTHKVPVQADEHIVDSMWRFTQILNIASDRKAFKVNIDPEAKKSVQKLILQSGLSSDQDYAVLLIGGTEAAKRWPVDRFAQLAHWLKQRYDLTALLPGAGAVEASLAEQMVEQSRSPVINLIGKTNLQQLLALLEGAKLIVGNDSGPLHLAAALDVNLIALYGPTNPAIVGPYGHLDTVIEAGKGVNRRQRYSKEPQHRIDAISLERVTQAIERQLER